MPNYLQKTIGFVVVLMCFHNVATATCTEKESKKTDGKKDIVTFFSNYLGGKHTLYEEKGPIAFSKVGETQSSVWEAWKNANQNFPEQKLMDLEPLQNGRNASWNLPADLEPNAVMPYYFGYKGEMESGKQLPLYLYLHGSGSKSSEWATGLSICKNFKDSPSIYFIPQIPNEGDYYRWGQGAKQFAWEKLLRLAFLSGNIDPNRVYLFGISEGGYGSQRMASFYADYLAAAGPMAGGEPLKNAPVENCRNIAFSLRTGANDQGFYRNKLTNYTKEEFENFQQKYPESFIHNVELIPGRGHGIDYNPTTPWMSQYTRNPYPKFVSWENFEMYGIYRTGFYNLFVKERSNDTNDTRTYYEMKIEENNISLKVDLVGYKATEIDPRWGIELKHEKTYTPATKGKIIIFLNDQLVDLSKNIVLTVNGKKVFSGKVKPELKNIINSCAIFFDPQRLYPAAIEVDLSEL